MNVIPDEEKKYYDLTRKAFDFLAPFYDAAVFPFSGLRDRVAELTGAGNAAKILDVATGTGKQAFAFAKKGYAVTGVDITESMLSVARRKNKFPNVKFEIADATKLEFDSGSFDVVSISFALHDMPLSIRERVLAEMARVTKPEGNIVIVDYFLPKNKIGKFLIYHIISLYEGEYYKKFIKSDLRDFIENSGIYIKEEVPALFGAARIIKGVKNQRARENN